RCGRLSHCRTSAGGPGGSGRTRRRVPVRPRPTVGGESETSARSDQTANDQFAHRGELCLCVLLFAQQLCLIANTFLAVFPRWQRSFVRTPLLLQSVSI